MNLSLLKEQCSWKMNINMWITRRYKTSENLFNHKNVLKNQIKRDFFHLNTCPIGISMKWKSNLLASKTFGLVCEGYSCLKKYKISTSLKMSISIFSCLVFPIAIETKCYHWTIYWVKKSQNTQLSLLLPPLHIFGVFLKRRENFCVIPINFNSSGFCR